MRKRSKHATRASKWEKRVDETLYFSGRRRGAVLKEEIWYAGADIAKYSLAYIDPRQCAVDNGRVLGYDNSHGVHHRHFRGRTETIKFAGYEQLLARFEREVRAIRRLESDEEDHDAS